MAHSSNLIIGGTFNSAQGDFHIHNKDESGFHTLLRLGVSLGAIHDSSERCPPPNCHPDTRKAVRQIILNWINSESSTSSFFWLYGSAGAGKTAILQAIAEFLCTPSESSQNFGGSFFFSRGKKGRDQGHFLFPTIAYQLALKVPGLRQHVNRITDSDPTLYAKSMDVQLQALIVDAFRCLSPLPQRPYLVIIDGLDECHDKTTQQSILRLLCDTITVHKLPLRFLIGSRPETHIRNSFDRESLYTVTQRVVLDETFDPGRDIQVFLQDGFAKIHAENPILSRVEQPWPKKGIIDLLVQRSSGQFIYAATVLKFVGADFYSPTKQLALVLKPDHTAFSDLDQLYTQILSVYPSAVNIVQVLGIIIASDGGLPEVIEDILGMEEGELKLVLRGLSSLMKDENEEYLPLNKGVSYVIPHFAHASFSDYLFNSSRSGPFHVNKHKYEAQFTIRSFELILQSIRSRRMPSTTQVLHTATWDYFSGRLSRRFIRSLNVAKEAIMTDINDLVQEFSSDGAVGLSFFAMLRLFEILQKCLHLADPDELDDRIRADFKILFDEYRKMLDQLLCASKDLGDMIRFLPGVVVQNCISMQGMADLYRTKPDLLERFIKSTIEPLSSFAIDAPCPRYILKRYLFDFLQDRDRSQLYYCSPMLQHIYICRQFLFLLGPQSHELSHYAKFHFYDHLTAATSVFHYAQIISDDHPAVKFFHDLENTAYYVHENLSCHTSILSRCIIQAILRWADSDILLKGVAVTVVSNVNFKLMERVCHLTNKIYREMLCTTSHERANIITIRGFDHVHVDSFSWTTPENLVLSWDLLDLISVMDGILCSFTNFITTRELSGPLYISPDIYHTQITEYSLETIFYYFQSSGFKVSDANWSFREHISLALPTKKIFNLLRSIRSTCLVRDYSTRSMLDILENIIKWFQGLGFERPNDLYDRFQGELLRLPPQGSPSSSESESTSDSESEPTSDSDV